MAVSNLSWQYAFIPQGEGLHGLEDTGGAGVAKITVKTYNYNLTFAIMFQYSCMHTIYIITYCW